MTPSDWGPGWVRLEDGRGVHRDEFGPCKCGELLFSITRRTVRDEGSPPRVVSAVVCPKCIRLKPGEVVVGRIDMRSGEITKVAQAERK